MAREVWVVESKLGEANWLPIETFCDEDSANRYKENFEQRYPDPLRTRRVVRYVPEDEK